MPTAERSARRRAVGEGSVFFDKSKNRWIGSTFVGGKRRKVVGRTKSDARQRLDALRRKAEAGAAVGHGNVTVAEVMDLWLRPRARNSRCSSHYEG